MLRPRRRLHGKTRVDPQEVEVHRQRVGKTHVEPQEVEEPSTHDDPVDDVSMDGDDTLRCDQCEQLFGTIDIHCQVGRRIKWGKFNISRVTERKKATSRQCYPCLRWQRHKKFRTLAKAVSWLFPKGKKHDDRWTKMMGFRKGWMNGQGWSPFFKKAEPIPPLQLTPLPRPRPPVPTALWGWSGAAVPRPSLPHASGLSSSNSCLSAAARLLQQNVKDEVGGTDPMIRHRGAAENKTEDGTARVAYEENEQLLENASSRNSRVTRFEAREKGNEGKAGKCATKEQASREPPWVQAAKALARNNIVTGRTLNVRWPYSQLLINRLKEEENRGEPLGGPHAACANEIVWVIETPGFSTAGKETDVLEDLAERPKRAQYIGTVEFSHSTEYLTMKEFQAKLKEGACFDWDGQKPRFAWHVATVRKLHKPLLVDHKKPQGGLGRPRSVAGILFEPPQPDRLVKK